MGAGESVKTLRAIAKRCDGTHSCWYSGALKNAADCIESLQAQLAESQRRERAAVADITHDCDTCLYAGCAWDKPPCETCIEGEFLSGVKRTDNWQWRGPAAGEGDAK